MIALRPYQVDLVERTRAAFARWGLRGYSELYLDTNRVTPRVVEMCRRGVLEKTGTCEYRVTEKGRAV